ncbi:hypothetical protein C8R47DRAFT_89971 [Mycena vitilis]|nr:hypothetical protein C8R47DRAFT_89971 [Mycena vitilis]
MDAASFAVTSSFFQLSHKPLEPLNASHIFLRGCQRQIESAHCINAPNLRPGHSEARTQHDHGIPRSFCPTRKRFGTPVIHGSMPPALLTRKASAQFLPALGNKAAALCDMRRRRAADIQCRKYPHQRQQAERAPRSQSLTDAVTYARHRPRHGASVKTALKSRLTGRRNSPLCALMTYLERRTATRWTTFYCVASARDLGGLDGLPRRISKSL